MDAGDLAILALLGASAGLFGSSCRPGGSSSRPPESPEPGPGGDEGTAEGGGASTDDGGSSDGSTGDSGGGDDGGSGGPEDSGGEPVDPCGDPTLIPTFSPPDSPALSPVSEEPQQGSDNIYAPDVIRVSESLCLMYYGGQGTDGHDQIFLATSTDCLHWAHWPDRDDPEAVVANGSANHVNDPSVAVHDGTWFMYYTVAATGEDDRIHLATSSDGFTWSLQGMVLDTGPAGAWDSHKVGRPAVRRCRRVGWRSFRTVGCVWS